MREFFNKYVETIKNQKDRSGKLVNPWAQYKNKDFWDTCWHKIEQSGLKFDGHHITINQNGVSYDYVAYKNKMLLAYPESKIDVELVYKGDTFAFEKSNGVVDYKHIFGNPFQHKDEDIIGGYCIIKNKRGEFITTLSRDEIEKAKKVAKTDAIWKMWFAEMAKKTVIKKAVKFHFDDVYAEMEEEDNKNYDPEKVIDKPELSEALVNAINSAISLKALTDIYNREFNNLENAELKADFVSLCSSRKRELMAEAKNENS